MVFDAHLMIVEPEKYVEEFRKAGADIINFHVEATKYPAEVIQQIKATGAKAGITINPRTPVEGVYPYLKDVDMVLVMTVNPGYGGQKIVTRTFSKIAKLRSINDERNLSVDIEVEGGVNLQNIEEIKQAGANVFVAGTKIFKGNVEENIKNFKEILK